MARTVTTTSKTARTRTGIGKSRVIRRSSGGGGGGGAPAKKKAVSTTVKRLPSGAKIIVTKDPSSGKVISTTFKDPQGRTTTTAPAGVSVSSTGEVIIAKKQPVSAGERFETTEPGMTGFAGGRVSAIFTGSKSTGARKTFTPTVSTIERPGREPVKVVRSGEPTFAGVAEEREAQIARRGGTGLTEQQLREAEAKRKLPPSIALPSGEAERIKTFFKEEFGLLKAADIFKGVEEGTLQVKKKGEELIILQKRKPDIIIPPTTEDKKILGTDDKGLPIFSFQTETSEEAIKLLEERQSRTSLTEKIKELIGTSVEKGISSIDLILGDQKQTPTSLIIKQSPKIQNVISELKPKIEFVKEAGIETVNLPIQFTVGLGEGIARAIDVSLVTGKIIIKEKPPVKDIIKTLITDPAKDLPPVLAEQFDPRTPTGLVSIGAVLGGTIAGGAAIKAGRPKVKPKPKPKASQIVRGLKERIKGVSKRKPAKGEPFKQTRLDIRGQRIRGFQPKGKELGLTPSEIQATLKRPKRISKLDLFEEIRLEPKPEVRTKLSEELRFLIEKEAPPKKAVSVQAFLRERFIAEETARAKTAQTFIARERIIKSLRIELEKPPRTLFLEERIATGQQTVFDIGRPPITRAPARLPPREGVQVTFRKNILTGRKGQQRLIPEIGRVFERPREFFRLRPESKFKAELFERLLPSTRLKPLTLPLLIPLTKAGIIPLSTLISSQEISLESRLELGTRSKLIQEIELTQEVGLRQRARIGLMQEQAIGQEAVVEQEQRQILIPRKIVDEFVKGKTLTETTTTTKVPRPRPRLRLPSIPSEKVKKQGFDVLVRESRPKGKGKRAFFKVNPDPLPKNKALNLGADLVDNSSARTFKIVTSKKSTEKSDDARFNRAHKFRRPKGRTRLPSGSYVEETQHLIDTPGERKGITAKGLIALRRKSKIAKNLVGNKSAFGTINKMVKGGKSLRSIRALIK